MFSSNRFYPLSETMTIKIRIVSLFSIILRIRQYFLIVLMQVQYYIPILDHCSCYHHYPYLLQVFVCFTIIIAVVTNILALVTFVPWIRSIFNEIYVLILFTFVDMADNKGQSTKKPTDSQKKLQESQAQVDEVSTIILIILNTNLPIYQFFMCI